MKGHNLLITALIIFAVGVVMIIMYKSISSTGIVIIGGILFLIAGMLNILATELSGGKKQEQSRNILSITFNRLSSTAAIILGACMLFFSGTFATLVNFMFGLLVLFGACHQFYILIRATRPSRLPGWLYTAPSLMIGAAVYLFIMDSTDNDMGIMLATGIALLIYGIAGTIEAILIRRKAKLTINTPQALDK